ncbi:BrnT family toxin [Acidithiobacillus sp. MC6.1]|nr:BrnT family toxin [Acidithiobacillus sp. MC6.1]
MNFTWDPRKRQINLRGHSVDFADAVGVFFDDAAMTMEDRDSEGEQRLVTMGRDFLDRVLLVVYTERNHEEIRLISARKASAAERRQYAGGAR